MDEGDISLEAYDKLNSSMPSIGFLSRRKRAMAFIKVTKLAQQMIDDQMLSEENALFLLSILARKNASFQKSVMMTALNLASIGSKRLSAIGFKHANNMRCNLQMVPIDEDVSSDS